MKKYVLIGLFIFSLVTLQGCNKEEDRLPLSQVVVDKIYYKDHIMYIVTTDYTEYVFDYNKDSLAFRGTTSNILVSDNGLLLQLPSKDKQSFMDVYEEQKKKASE